MGPSGCGKTTLLSILAGLMEPDVGTLTYRLPGIAPVGRLTAALRRDHVGIVFQSIHLIPTLTVLENIEIPMFGVERSQSRRMKRTWEILEMLGLEELANKLPHLLSGGERQRVAVGRAFANHPSLVFADEPTGNLDTASSNRVVAALLDMAAQTRGALIVVTHNEAVAERMQRTLEIVDGHIVEPAMNR
jgi:putative ABC transport system ATP-binding protein